MPRTNQDPRNQNKFDPDDRKVDDRELRAGRDEDPGLKEDETSTVSRVHNAEDEQEIEIGEDDLEEIAEDDLEEIDRA